MRQEPAAATMSLGAKQNGLRRNLIIAIGGLLLSVACWSLSSPPLSTPDENWHIANIWCANGPDKNHCIERDFTRRSATYAYVPPQCAHRNASQPAQCATPRSSTTVGPLFMSEGGYRSEYPGPNYPSMYRKAMNEFVSSDGSLSILRMKLFNGVLFVVLVLLLLYGVPSIISRIAITTLAVTMVPLSISLISSINPSGWGIAGVFGVWVSMTALAHHWFVMREQAAFRKIALLVALLLSALLATQARRDSAFMAVAVATVVVAEIAIRLGWRFLGKKLILIGSFFALCLSVVVFRSWGETGPSLFGFTFPSKFEPLNPAGPTFDVWLTNWITHFPAVFLDAFGNSGLGEGHEIVVPRLVVIIGVSVLGGVLFYASKVGSPSQFVSLSLLTFAFACVLWFATLEFDLYNVPGRYLMPLFPVIVGTYVYYSRSPAQLFDLLKLRRIAIGLLGIAHALGLYTVVERYSAGSSGGVRSIPIRFDEWWWPAMPIGPNGVVIIGSISWVTFLVFAFRATESSDEQLEVMSEVS